jgi:hypothetical protein
MEIEDLHQQARLTTGTVAYNDQLSTDFRHSDGRGSGGVGRERQRKGSESAEKS